VVRLEVVIIVLVDGKQVFATKKPTGDCANHGGKEESRYPGPPGLPVERVNLVEG
jgi:hypothetical protein